MLKKAGASNPRVLLIDTDSQAHASLVTTGTKDYGTDNSLYTVLMADRQHAAQTCSAALCSRHGTRSAGGIDMDTMLFRSPDSKGTETTHYRDEDGELRAYHSDRSGIPDMPLEEIAAEFLRAKSDTEAAPDALEREVIAAMRDIYRRELRRRVTIYGITNVKVDGQRYKLVPLPAVGYVHLLAIE